jgi:hypothetical protein
LHISSVIPQKATLRLHIIETKPPYLAGAAFVAAIRKPTGNGALLPPALCLE